MKNVGDRLENKLDKAGIDFASYICTQDETISKDRQDSIAYEKLELMVWNPHFTLSALILNWRELWN